MTFVLTRSSEVKELGLGFNFKVLKDERTWPAFIIRVNGVAKSYLNVCAHVGLRLNGNKNEYFGKGRHLICRSHGAIFESDTGECIQGPCIGFSLISLEIREDKEFIYYEDKKYELIT